MSDKITELNPIETPQKFQPVSAEIFSFKWFVQWSSLLAVVFLTASTLNCLFRWLSYGYPWDLAGMSFSLALAAVVYFTAFNNSKIASFRSRLIIAFLAISTWAVFFPVVMKLFGFK